MPHLQENSLRVIRILESHCALDTVQIASRAELSVTATQDALAELSHFNLVIDDDGIFSLNSHRLSELLEAA